MVLACVSDLMSSTRIQDAARHLGHSCTVVRRPEALLANLDDADLVIADLDIATGDGVEAVRLAHHADRPVVAYGGHVAVERLQAAWDAGADAVLTRGEFVRRLPELLAEVVDSSG